MKRILVFLLLMSCLQSFGQIRFSLYSYDPCSKEIRHINFFSLKKDDVIFNTEDTTGVLSLEETGTYVLTYALENIDSTQLGKKYDIKTIGNFSDTLRLLSINTCLEPTTTPNFTGYCCCDEKCEGEQVDYYSNGNKRIEGCFKEGIPQGELKMYYPGGELKQVDKYNKKGHLKKRILYDESGQVKGSETY